MKIERWCKHCQKYHPLTTGFWYNLQLKPRCRIAQRAANQKVLWDKPHTIQDDLWEFLRQSKLGAEFSRNKMVRLRKNYPVDFFCPLHGIVVRVVEKVHQHKPTTKNIPFPRLMQENGYTLIDFTPDDVKNPTALLEKIRNAIKTGVA